jgi:hypothetical protein
MSETTEVQAPSLSDLIAAAKAKCAEVLHSPLSQVNVSEALGALVACLESIEAAAASAKAEADALTARLNPPA